jgi:hypothetical protein
VGVHFGTGKQARTLPIEPARYLNPTFESLHPSLLKQLPSLWPKSLRQLMSQVEATYAMRAQLGGWWQLSDWERQVKKQWQRNHAQGSIPPTSSQAATRTNVLVKPRSNSVLTFIKHERTKVEGAGNSPGLAHAR